LDHRWQQQRCVNTSGLNNIFDRDTGGIQIRNVAETGIELEDGLTMASSCIVIGGKVFLWKTPGPPWTGWTQDDFELFNVIVPKPGKSYNTLAASFTDSNVVIACSSFFENN
jgi:hypothetical protein